MWNDLNKNNVIDGAETSVALGATGITVLALPSLAEDAATNIEVVVAVTNAAVANQYRSFTLVAAVADAGGAALTADNSVDISPGGTASNAANNLNAVESVFEDAGICRCGRYSVQLHFRRSGRWRGYGVQWTKLRYQRVHLGPHTDRSEIRRSFL